MWSKNKDGICISSTYPFPYEKWAYFWFDDRDAEGFSTEIIHNQNTMFCNMDVLPESNGTELFVKYVASEKFMFT